MRERIDVILTEYPGYGWGIESPQLPGFVGGRSTREELEADLDDILEFAEAPRDAVRAIHWQSHLTLPDGDECVVRVHHDRHVGERMDCAKSVMGALSLAEQRTQVMDVPRTRTGEVLFVCALATDHVGWLVDQLDPRGETAVFAVAVAEQFIYTTALHRGDIDDETEEWLPLSEFGWDADTTVSEIMQYQKRTEKRDLTLLAS